MRAGFSQAELLRYAQQLKLPQVGLEGQRKLRQASVLIIGAGGLGSVASLYLAGAGVGRIGLVDGDRVELSNLPRQVLYAMEDLGRPKTEAAQQRLSARNPHCQIEVFPTMFAAANAAEISQGYPILVDGTDNLPARYLINDLCARTGRSFVYGAVDCFEGQMAVFDPRSGPCYRCAFGEPTEGRGLADRGVFGPLPGLVGMLQAAAAIGLILGIGESLAGKLLLVNSLDLSIEQVMVERDQACAACGETPQSNR
jgi:adenylyltransferase/sulfurtransferase